MSKEINEKLVKGMLEPLILGLINEKPRHGYGIMSEIRKIHKVRIGASTLYPELNCLSNKGYIKSVWEMNGIRPRKVYAITPQGKRRLQEYSYEMQIVVKPFLQIQVQN